MTDWEWFAGDYGSVENEGVYPAGPFPTKTEAIAELQSIGIEPIDGKQMIYVIEARSSTAMRYEGEEVVPFLRTRNKELIELGPRAA